ncbi:hypothetical protein V8G54_035876, partial [Vigna mungo]
KVRDVATVLRRSTATGVTTHRRSSSHSPPVSPVSLPSTATGGKNGLFENATGGQNRPLDKTFHRDGPKTPTTRVSSHSSSLPPCRSSLNRHRRTTDHLPRSRVSSPSKT